MSEYAVMSMAGGLAGGIFLLFIGVSRLTRRSRGSVQRLESYVRPEQEPISTGRQPSGIMLAIERWMSKQTFGASIARDLAQADIKLTVAEYLSLHVTLFLAGLVLGPVLLHAVIAGPLVGLILLLAPKFYVSTAQGKRLTAFNQQLPAALNSLSNSLRGGYGLLQAMKLVSAEMSPPISVEFQRVVSEVSYGLSYDLAFANMIRRNDSPDLSLVITAISINLEVGGNLSEILDNISAIIRDRVRILGQVAALTSQARLSGMVLTILPFGLGGILIVVNRAYMSQLWETTAGLLMLAVAVGLVVVGSIVLRRIARINV